MTIKELSKYHNLKIEMEQIEDIMKELESTVIGSSKITGMPLNTLSNSNNPTERIALKLAKLRTKLEAKTEKLLDELHKIEDFLNTVEDEEIKIIVRERFINGKTWKEVSKTTISDRTTPYYKLKKYLSNIEKE